MVGPKRAVSKESRDQKGHTVQPEVLFVPAGWRVILHLVLIMLNYAASVVTGFAHLLVEVRHLGLCHRGCATQCGRVKRLHLSLRRLLTLHSAAQHFSLRGITKRTRNQDSRSEWGPATKMVTSCAKFADYPSYPTDPHRLTTGLTEETAK